MENDVPSVKIAKGPELPDLRRQPDDQGAHRLRRILRPEHPHRGGNCFGRNYRDRIKELLDTNDELQLIDVREPHEYEIARIPRAQLIPLGQVVARSAEIDPSRTAVIQCKGGVRSAKAIADLRAAGYPGRLINLKGGIGAWSTEVDPTVPDTKRRNPKHRKSRQCPDRGLFFVIR